LRLSLNPANRSFFNIVGALYTLQAKSLHNTMKSSKEATWKDNPAIIMLTPKSVLDFVFAPEAIAPPAACSNKEMKSHVMKTMVYVRGLTLERSSP
jgi:hypothetical protein